MKYNSPELMQSLVDKVDSEVFDKEVFNKAGVFVLRNALPKETVQEWRSIWDEYYKSNLDNGRTVNTNNPVAFMDEIPEALKTIYRHEGFVNIVKMVFGENVALYNHRFVIKDKFSPGEVFLHQDYCYHMGFHNKASFFTPMGYAGKRNGGLTFYLGTHHYGFLGDAGEVDPDAFAEQWPTITPDLDFGDIAIMNSLLWHGSGSNIEGIDRIVADIICQPANDPSSIELLAGHWETDIFLDRKKDIKSYFKTSRVTKIIDLNQKLNAKS